VESQAAAAAWVRVRAVRAMTGHGMMDGRHQSGWIFDACHDRIAPGDVVIASYRGTPSSRFEVLSDDGTGMFMVRDPDGRERPMRPSNLLNVAERIERP
jgi:hypothetical protein